MQIRILLADDHRLLREGLRSLIEEEEDMEVVGEADDGREAFKLFEQHRPHVIIMDVSMPGLNGIEATSQISGADKQVKIVGLSMHADSDFVRRMLDAGACGYLLKDCAFDELITAIRSVLHGEVYLSPKIARLVVDDYLQGDDTGESSALGKLTSREREVLQLLAEGYSSKQIARLLDVSSKTVDTHRRNIMEKLEIYNIPDLTKFAIREGLTSVQE